MRGTLTVLVLAAMAGGCSNPQSPPHERYVDAKERDDALDTLARERAARIAATGAANAQTAGRAEPAPTTSTQAPLPETGSMPGRAIPEFRATVSRKAGDAWSSGPIDSRKAKGATLWIMNSTTCGYCSGYADRMKAIESAYMPRGVDVVHVYPVKAETDLEKVEYHAKHGFRGGQILDADSNIARSLVVDKTPTVFVTDARGVLLYRGAIDSSSADPAGAKPYLAEALDAVLAGKPVPVAETEPEG